MKNGFSEDTRELEEFCEHLEKNTNPISTIQLF